MRTRARRAARVVAGRTVCDGRDDVACVDADAGVNACGGCAVLAGEPGDDCGVCGGAWACDPASPERVVCEGPALNACGSCGDLAGLPGSACSADGVDGRWACDAGAASCQPAERNTCGGTTELDALPGEACGGCAPARSRNAPAPRPASPRDEGDAAPRLCFAGPDVRSGVRGERGPRVMGSRGAIGGAPRVSEARATARAAERSDPAHALAPGQRARYEALRQWRNQQARESGKPPYLLFSNTQAAEIARAGPTSLTALGQIAGIGPSKIDAWGAAGEFGPCLARPWMRAG